jgi:L-lactate dehydrogenase complex protein LldG
VREAREEILARIRHALADAPATADAPPAPPPPSSGRDLVQLLAERVADYRAEVLLTADPGAAVAAALAAHGARRVGVAPGLDPALRPPDVELVDDDGLDPGVLDALDGAVTSAAAACAETGTLAFDGGPGQGRRALTLVPDLHVCVVAAGDIVETVPELFARLEPAAAAGRPLVLVSGPSATSDIELERVEGVHGPRRLVVVVDTRP